VKSTSPYWWVPLPDYQLAQRGIPWKPMKAHRAKNTNTFSYISASSIQTKSNIEGVSARTTPLCHYDLTHWMYRLWFAERYARRDFPPSLRSSLSLSLPRGGPIIVERRCGQHHPTHKAQTTYPEKQRPQRPKLAGYIHWLQTKVGSTRSTSLRGKVTRGRSQQDFIDKSPYLDSPYTTRRLAR